MVASRLNSDTEVVQEYLSTGFQGFIQSIVFLFGMFCVLFYISSKLTGVVLLGMLVMGIGVSVFVVIMEQLGKDIQAAKAEMNTVAEETFANIRTVKAFANEKTECLRFRTKNEKVLALGKKRAYISGIMSLFGELVGAIIFGYLIHVAY